MKCKNCGHEIRVVSNKEKYHKRLSLDVYPHYMLEINCKEKNCSCTKAELESEKIVIEYNKNPHGKAEIGITTAEVSQ